MKTANRYGLLLLLLSGIGLYPIYAQEVIPVEDKMLRDSIGENATRNTKQAGYLTLIRRMTKNTREDVEATERLQYNYRTFLRQTGSTASLAVSDSEIEQKAVGQGADASGYLSNYSFAQNLSEAYATQAVPMDKSQALYEQLIPYDEVSAFTNLGACQLQLSPLTHFFQGNYIELAVLLKGFK